MSDLGTLGGPLSVATAINGAGVVVGYSTKTGGVSAKQYPFRWKDGVMRELPSLPGNARGNFARANAIHGGRVVGVGAPDDADGDFSHALVWTNGVLADLGRMGGDYARAEDANAAGLVVGHIDHNPPDCIGGDAFVWNQGEVTLLPVLGGENGWAGAAAINRAGLVVGFSETDIGSGDARSAKFTRPCGHLTRNGALTAPAGPAGRWTRSAPDARPSARQYTPGCQVSGCSLAVAPAQPN